MKQHKDKGASMKQHEDKGAFSFTTPKEQGDYGKKEMDWLYSLFDLPTEEELAAEAYHCLTSRY